MKKIYGTDYITLLKVGLALIVSSLLFSFGIKVFLASAKAFPAGLGAITQLLTFVVKSLSKYYSALYLAMNVPLIILTFFLLSKRKFVIRTTFFLLLQVGWGQLFNFIFENSDPFNIGIWDQKSILEHNNAIQRGDLSNLALAPTAEGMVMKSWASIIQASIAGGFVGISSAIAWKFGGSTGGSDFLVYWISTKKEKSVGTVASIVSVLIAVFMIVIQAIMNNVPTGGGLYQQLLGPVTWSTFAYIFFNNIIINMLYPKYKKIKVTMTLKNPDKILAWLKETGYTHGFQIKETMSGYHIGTKIYQIETIMLFFEQRNFIKKAVELEPNIFISKTIIKGVVGNFDNSPVE